MINPIARSRNLAGNVRLLAPLMNGPLPALRYLINSRGKAEAGASGKYHGIEFEFRRRDLPALKEILLLGEYRFLTDLLKQTAQPLIFDIGSHIGLFSIWALSVNPRARIHGIEASPQTFKILSQNAARTTPGHSWSVQNRAAWHTNENVTFSDSVESSMSHRVDETGTVHVPGITLSDLVTKLADGQDITLLKIDIEGAEEAFLCADEGPLERVQNLVIELHPELCDADRVLRVLKKFFPDIQSCHDSSLAKPLLYCRK